MASKIIENGEIKGFCGVDLAFGRSDKTVYLLGKKLDPAKSQKLYNHSPDGFEWGYCGSGPAQLALATLLELTDEKIALKLHQDFKNDFLAQLVQGKNFRIRIVDIYQWLDEKK